MSPFRHRVRILAALSASAVGLVLVPAGTGAVAAGGFCSPGGSFSGTTITWTGKAHNHNWSAAGNWRPHTVPDASHTRATYQDQYVCIGKNKGGGAAKVQLTNGFSDHIAGIDIGNGAQLTVPANTRLFLGSKTGDPVVPSFVRSHSQLQLLGGVLGGNGKLTVAGTLQWTGIRKGKHKMVATQTSSECVFDPTINACPGDTSPGGGKTTIASSGKLLVNGAKFGGAVLGDGRVIDNSGTITLSNNGFIVMDRGTQLIDEPGSSLDFESPGGIYQGPKQGNDPLATLTQKGAVRKGGGGLSVVGVPMTLGKQAKRHIRVVRGGLSLQHTILPTSKVGRNSMYGVGGCTEPEGQLCRRPDANPADPQVATIGTSTAAPKVSKIGVALTNARAKLHGHRVLGQAINVTAPTIKTTHSTHLTFSFDAKTKGLPNGANGAVYRNKHRITLCKVHRLTATNTSCVLSEKVAHGGPAKGDLTVIVISIQPNASWLVTK